MAFGFEITAQNGKVYATPDTPFMHMTKRMVVNFTGTKFGQQAEDVNTGISSSLRFIPYAKSNVLGYFCTEHYQNPTTKMWHIKCEHSRDMSITFYFFTNQIPPSSGGWGVEIFDAKGILIYSTNTKPLANHQYSMAFKPSDGQLPKLDAKQPIACIPTPNQFWVQPIAGGMNVQFMVAAPVCVGNIMQMGVQGTGIMPSESGFSFAGFGGVTNYIYSSLYD